MKAAKGNPWIERHFKTAGWAKGVFEFRPASMFMTYTFAHIYCEREMNDLVLLTGSDDALRVVLNGKQVQKVQMQRGYNTDQDRVAGITLKKGWNCLLCKVDDYMGGHGLAVRFKTKEGKPVTNLRVCLSRPAEGAEPNFVDGVTYEAEAAKLLKDAVRLSAEEGDLAKAEAACREVAARYPKSAAAAEALYHAGSFLVQRGERPRAMETFQGLLTRYPYSKWAEDTLMATARLRSPGGRYEQPAVRVLAELLERFPKSSLVPEAMLMLGAMSAQKGDLDDSDTVLAGVREQFPNTVEAVRALDALGDNQRRRNDLGKARELWRQVIDEAKTLANGKYVWYVNVQTVLKEISDTARAKIEGKK
jgi:TolA-binding protein